MGHTQFTTDRGPSPSLTAAPSRPLCSVASLTDGTRVLGPPERLYETLRPSLATTDQFPQHVSKSLTVNSLPYLFHRPSVPTRRGGQSGKEIKPHPTHELKTPCPRNLPGLECHRVKPRAGPLPAPGSTPWSPDTAKPPPGTLRLPVPCALLSPSDDESHEQWCQAVVVQITAEP